VLAYKLLKYVKARSTNDVTRIHMFLLTSSGEHVAFLENNSRLAVG
jgi:hypothetical protein